MSYETRVDEMIGKHVAAFQDELLLAKLMAHYVEKTPSMPYGYPIAVYRPLHVCRSPEIRQFVARTGGKLSNGVPKVLGMDVVDQYVLGLYNPRQALARRPIRTPNDHGASADPVNASRRRQNRPPHSGPLMTAIRVLGRFVTALRATKSTPGGLAQRG